MQVANNHSGKCLVLLIIKSKITAGYHFFPIKIVKFFVFFKGTIHNAGKDFLWKTICGHVSGILKIFSPFGLVIPFLRIYPEEIIIVVGKDLCTAMLPKALFITVENGNNLNNNKCGQVIKAPGTSHIYF